MIDVLSFQFYFQISTPIWHIYRFRCVKTLAPIQVRVIITVGLVFLARVLIRVESLYRRDIFPETLNTVITPDYIVVPEIRFSIKTLIKTLCFSERVNII